MTSKFILAATLTACFACSGNKNAFEDETLKKIADLQDRRQTDSLVNFLSSDNPKYRTAAALAFASVQDTTAIPALANLSDTEAAFALGQMYNHSAVQALVTSLGNTNASVQIEALEGLGKVINKQELRLLTDDMNAEGIAWAYYYAGLRNVSDTASARKAAMILNSPVGDRMARLGAAHFFSRSQFASTPLITRILTDASQEDDAEVKMAMVNALWKLKPEDAIEAIKTATDDPDYRVRVNAARALRSQPWDVAKPVYEKLLNDVNPQVNVAAAEALANVSKDTIAMHDWAKNAHDWRAQATLYSKLTGVDNEVKPIYNNSNNVYQKAALLNAMSDVNFVFDEFKKNEAKVIKSTAASILADKASDVEMFKQIIADGDQGSIIYICNALRDTTRGFKKIITDYSFLEQAKSKLSLPRDYETYEPLERALNYFKGLPPPEPLKNSYNHPIDWKVAATIRSDQKVKISTTKGDIVMQLFVEEAPGSVVNFVNLVNNKYFDDKTFHRVVPNFVIQTGCNRGDGFGGEDYSIRSEFSRRKYKTGSVGMASAGKDTEGTQWFITHSPTPHLDGKYTIFAEVVSGMDVVHKIEVGDRIIEARLED